MFEEWYHYYPGRVPTVRYPTLTTTTTTTTSSSSSSSSSSSFAAARKPLAKEAIPNASINNVHK